VSMLDSFSTLVRGSRMRPEVREGKIFRHQRQDGLVETAKVLSIAPDSMGIAHVSYELLVVKSANASLMSRRTLNLDSFQSHFEELDEAI
jgi:hypothetical protein